MRPRFANSSLNTQRFPEIGIQEARKLRPDLSDDALLKLAKTVHELSEMLSNA